MMSRIVIALLLIGLAAGAFAQENVATVMEQLRSEDAATRKAAGEKATQIGAPMVAPLLEMYAEGTSLAESVAEGVLRDIVARATEPGEQTQAAVALALGQVAEDPARPSAARVLAARLLGLVEGRSVTAALGSSLSDPITHEAACNALQRMPGRAATEMLANSLWTVPEEYRVALIRSLAARRSPYGLYTLMWVARRGRGPLRTAAIDGLGGYDEPRVLLLLAELATDDNEAVRSSAVGALLAVADSEQQSGGPFARRCYRRAYDYAVTDAQRTGALLGLAETDPSNRVKWLTEGLEHEHSRRACEALLGRDGE